MTPVRSRDSFSLDVVEDQRLVPTLMEEILARRDAFVRDALEPQVSRHGPIPYRALANEHHHHDGAVFDLFLDSYGDAAADQDLLDLEWALHALSNGPWNTDTSRTDRDAAIERLVPAAARFGADTPAAARLLAETWLDDQTGYLADYLGHIALVERSDVVARLWRMRAAHALEPGRNSVRIVIAEPAAAHAIERTFR